MPSAGMQAEDLSHIVVELIQVVNLRVLHNRMAFEHRREKVQNRYQYANLNKTRRYKGTEEACGEGQAGKASRQGKCAVL